MRWFQFPLELETTPEVVFYNGSLTIR